MTRINLFRNTAVRSTLFRNTPAMLNSIAWGKINLGTTASPFVFAAILIICSLAVGCSSEKPKTESSTNQLPATQSTPPVATSTPTPVPIATIQAPAKPVHKKVVRKAPATVTYADKNSGVSFQYPRKYALKTGDAADELLSSGPVPMDFVQPGGGAIAAVLLPEGAYPKSDLASAFFDVSVNKTLTSEQCGEFSEANTSPATPVEGTGKPAASTSKMMINDMELQSTETLSTDGSRKEASKYYHAFENGACYEFALKVATIGVETDEGGKHVDRDEIFKRLEKILATVKIKPVKDTEVTASAPAAQTSTAVPATPAQ
jgi:hypothetical protein